MGAYKKYFVKEKYKESEKFSKGIFSLPLYPELKLKEVYGICKKLRKILDNV